MEKQITEVARAIQGLAEERRRMTVADICAEASDRTECDIQWSDSLGCYALHVDEAPADSYIPITAPDGETLGESATLAQVLDGFRFTFGE